MHARIIHFNEEEYFLTRELVNFEVLFPLFNSIQKQL